MTSYTQTVSRRLPRGWLHLLAQIGFWLGFYVVYQLARGFADRDVSAAFWNGIHVIRIENWSGTLFEPALQRLVDSSSILITATTYTYWLSQFAVVGLTLIWVYFKHHEKFAGFRNWLIGANLVGLVCYVLVPTAPPRLYPEWGFVDTLAQHSSLNHESGSSLSRRTPTPRCRASTRWTLSSSGSSCSASAEPRGAGALAALARLGLVLGHGHRQPLLARRLRGRRPRRSHRPRALPPDLVLPLEADDYFVSESTDDGPRVSELDRVKQEYTQAARQILQRSMKGVAKTKLTPDMLTMAGVTLCLVGAVLVGFEERNPKLYFWVGGILFIVGSVADILDGALARAASKGTVFGAFLDSTFDRLGEAAMLAAIGLVFAREGNDIALVAAFAAVIGSFLVSYTRAKAEALGLRGDVGFGSRVERVVLISVGLGLAPWGWLQWPIYILAAMAWITVVQRILFVRRQLRELAGERASNGCPGRTRRCSSRRATPG